MSTENRYGYGYNDSRTLPAASPAPHCCNCIGCCRTCGTCRTHPKHNVDTCGKIAELNAERAKVLA